MSSSARVPATASHTPFFPLARYTSIVGVHSSLVLFTALFLPRTSLSDVIPAPLLAALPLRGDGLPTPVKGTDHPQPLFLVQLTASPVATLAWICAGLVLLQVWWAEWLKKWAEEYQRSLLGTGEKAREAENKENDRLARTGAVLPWRVDDIAKVGDAAACTGLATTLVYGVLVCAGAPLTSHLLHTTLFAMLFAILAIFPAAYLLGSPIELSRLLNFSSDVRPSAQSFHRRIAWIRVFVELSPKTPVETALLGPAMGALAGAWLGAIPLALDWERPWQAWPLTPAYGAVFGSVAGALGALVFNAVAHLADLGRARAADLRDRGTVEKEPAGPKKADTKEGKRAVEEMRKNVQAAMAGLGGGQGVKVEVREAVGDESGEGDAQDEGGVGSEDDDGLADKPKAKRRRRRGKKNRDANVTGEGDV